ncbi:MAG: hypothetical protein DRI75_05885 [Bacteroidetes bacterium]|nr:MAG: hypothetical protein DRI75_05885 [Bacteroidota bacterium]
MKKKSRKRKQFSRRGILPILGGALFIPYLGFGKSDTNEIIDSGKKEEYQTLLKPDGTAVKVKMSVIHKSKVIKKNLSNKSFLNWLGKKF